MKILFSKSNLTRKVNYQIATSIYEDSNKKYSRKLALSNKSLPHLQKMNKTYLKLRENSILTPKIVNNKKNYIDFEYLPFLTIDTIIERLIFTHQFDKTKKLLKIYLSFMSSLKEIKILPYKNRAFTKLFDTHEVYNQDEEEICLDQSILDYNLDNLLFDENKNRLYLIDWEWVVDFPLVKNYVVFRSVFYLSSKLQSLITTFCSKDFPCYEILSDFLIPKIWWDLFDFSQKDVERFLFYEFNFQNSVNTIKIDFKKIIALKEKKLINNRTSLNLDSYIQNIIFQKSVQTEKNKADFEETKTKLEQLLLQKSLDQKKIEKLESTITGNKNYIKNLLFDITSLKDDLNKIQASKVYKFWQTYCKIRDDIINKLKINKNI